MAQLTEFKHLLVQDRYIPITRKTLVLSSWQYFKRRNFHGRNFRDFETFLGKFTRVYTRKILDLVAFMKVNSREKFQLLGPESIFPLLREPYKTIILLDIYVADSNISCQHVYSKYVPLSPGMIYQIYSQKLFLAKKTLETPFTKVITVNAGNAISHISRFFSPQNFLSWQCLPLKHVCDLKYPFTLVDIGDSGSHSDGSVSTNSFLGRVIENNTLNIPKLSPVSNSEMCLPFLFVGDNAFRL